MALFNSSLLLIFIGQLIILVNVKCVVYVNTTLGTVKGISMLSRNGRIFNAFLGIPFAKPPVGDLRFQNPIPVTKPWDGVLDATHYPPKCIQPFQGNIEGSEDCLYLNLYFPKSLASETLLPVWVFIYGGKKLFGDAAPYKYGPEYIMDKPVILITVSYRMGAFGFLSTEDNVISGNFGLKDETAVLKWIQNHIHSFGGDPKNVTLSGGSSGGIDVSLHLYSPLSKGLFHKAISQSGHSLNSEVVHPPGAARSLAWDLGRLVGCYAPNIKTSERLWTCLKNIPAIALARASQKLSHDYILPFMLFGPVIESKYNDGAFLINDPCEDIEVSNSIPWILGSIPDEGSQRTLRTIEIARRYKGPLYLYCYDYKNDYPYLKTYLQLLSSSTKYKIGAVHGEELISLFNNPLMYPPVITGNDRIVSDQVVDLWYNFVATGDPNGNTQNKLWMPVTPEKLNYLHINNLTLKMQDNYYLGEEYEFWKEIGSPTLCNRITNVNLCTY